MSLCEKLSLQEKIKLKGARREKLQKSRENSAKRIERNDKMKVFYIRDRFGNFIDWHPEWIIILHLHYIIFCSTYYNNVDLLIL